MNPIFVESMLLESLELMASRRIAKAILRDVTKLRCGAPLPSELEELRRFVRGDLADACYLRLGGHAERALLVIEDRLEAFAATPVEHWSDEQDRLVFVGRSALKTEVLARAVRASDVAQVCELHELFIAVEPQRRTCVLVDAADCPLPFDVLAAIAVDFPPMCTLLVTSADGAVREKLVRSGAAFRATLFAEQPTHDRVIAHARAALDGAPVRHRSSGGTTTTTAPRAA